MAINASSDIALLFGVLGGGEVSGQSGTLIRRQLNQLIGQLNKDKYTNERRIRLTLDQTNTKDALLKSLKKVVNTVDGQNKFKLKVSEINATSAINKLRDQLNDMLKTIKVDTGFAVTMGTNGASSAIKEISEDAKGALLPLEAVEAKLKEIDVLNNAQTAEYKNATKTLGLDSDNVENIQQLELLRDKYIELQAAIQKVQKNKGQTTQSEIDNIYRLRSALQELIQAEQARSATAKNNKGKNDALKQAYNLLRRIEKAQKDWTKAAHGTSRESYGKLQRYIDDLNNLITRYANSEDAAEDLRDELSRISRAFAESSGQIRRAGEDTQTFTERLGGLAGKFTTWLTISQLVMKVVGALRKMMDVTIEVDTAMTELKKVTNESDATYAKFLTNASVRAKHLGATITDVVTASADFARLGYSIDEASELADAAIVYKNIGDGISDINEASESIISTMQAFGIEATNVMTIVDKFNIVGNNFAISSSGIGSALLNSASSLAAAGNSLDESIALIAAANEVIQNPEKVGTAMKTMSMYIRAAKTEAEEAGISADGMASSVSELREEILALTGNQVDIMIDDNNFKSTVQIIRELSDVWGSLTDTTRTNITELIGGGVRNSNIITALISNFDTVEKVIATSANSAGSALKENEKHLDSIQGKLAEFKATFEKLSITLIDSESVKQIVDFGTWLLNILNYVAKAINAFGGLKTVLLSVISAFLMFKGADVWDSISKVFASLGGSIKDIIKIIPNAIAAWKAYAAATTAGAAKAALANTAMQATIPVIGLVIAGITAAISIFSLFGSTAEEETRSIEELDDALEEHRAKIEGIADSYRNLKTESESVIPRFVELADGVDKFGKNVSLTDEEYAEFLELNNKIAEMFPEINLGMDDAGNAMLALSYSADTLTASLNALVEAERAASYQEIADTMSTELGDINDQVKNFNDEIDKLKKERAEYEKLYSDYLNRNLRTTFSYDYGMDEADEYKRKLRELGISGNGRVDVPTTFSTDVIVDRNYVIDWDYSALDDGMAYIDKQLALIQEKYDKLINNFENKIVSLWSQLNPVVNAFLQTDFKFQAMNDPMQEIAATMVAGLDFSSLGLTTEDQVKGYVEDYILEPLYSAIPEVGVAFAQITDWEKQLASGEITEKEFSNWVQKLFGDLLKEIKVFSEGHPEIAETFKSIFASAYGEILNIENADFVSVVFGLIDAWSSGATSAKRFNSELSTMSTTIDSLQDDYDLLAQAQEDMLNGGLSVETIEKLAEAEENFLDYLYEENGLIKLNVEAWQERAKAQMAGDIAVLRQSISTLEAENAELEKNIERYNIEYRKALYGEEKIAGRDPDTYGTGSNYWADRIAEETIKLQENSDAITENQRLLSLYTSIFDDITAEEPVQSPLAAALGDTASDVDKIQRIMTAIQQNNFDALTKEDFSALLSVIPELKNELTDYYNAVEAGANPLDEQQKLLQKITAASKDFISENLSDAFSDVADKANQFGSDSYQAQAAMRTLSQYAPELAAALWDEGSAMYNLGDASEYTAEALLGVARVSLEKSIAENKKRLQELEAQAYLTAVALDTMSKSAHGERLPDTLGEMEALRDLIQTQLDELGLLGSLDFGSSGGSKTQADIIKEDFDALNSSLEHSIELQQDYYDQARESLNSGDMRSALILQIGYYKQIQTEAHKAAEALRAYYRSQGMSAAEIEQQSDIQSLSKTWMDAADSIREIMDTMTHDIVTAFGEAVDAIQSVYDTLHAAADEYAESGWITIDTLQEIINLGVEYMAFLQDENGQLVINEERIRDIIAARTQQMAVESALAYVESLRSAKMSGDIEELERLLDATTKATNATWGLVYASLQLTGLSDSEYQQALQNINALRAMADSAVNSIGQATGSVSESLNDMQTGMNDILQYVMDMIKQQIDEQTQAIEDQKDAYSELIEMKKKALEASKEESDYAEKVADLTKELADIQNKIDSLELVGTREAEAERAKLLEEQRELQKELADLQNDYATEAQSDALDQMEEAYHESKDEEIKILEDSISSQQKLYDLAIAYIQDNWDSLYEQLIAWNTEYGNVLNEEITSAWEQCLLAAQRYGDYVTALNSIQADIDSDTPNTTIGDTNYDQDYSDNDMVRAIVNRMKMNSAAWFTQNDQERAAVAEENKQLAAQLRQFGINAVLGQDGVWYIDRVGGQKLYEAIYHQGGIVGGGDVKSNEQIALLKDKEWVLSETMVGNLIKQMDIISRFEKYASRLLDSSYSPLRSPLNSIAADRNAAMTRIFNDNRDAHRVEISIGDTYISGANADTLQKHQQITKGWMDELARQLGVKW